MKSIQLQFSLLAVCLSALAMPASSQQSLQQVHGQLRAEVASGQIAPVASMPATQKMQITVMLPLRNQEALTSLLGQLYNPASPNYHQWLSVSEFTDQFGPTDADYQAVVDFSRANGLAVGEKPANRLLVPISGSVAQIESALHVKMNLYQHPTENRTFFSPDREPTLAVHVPIDYIKGLDNFIIPQPLVKKGTELEQPIPLTIIPPIDGSGPSGPWGASSYLPGDMRAAYYGDAVSPVTGQPLTGSGQCVGIYFSGYTITDVENSFIPSATATPLTSTYTNGADWTLTYSPPDGSGPYNIPIRTVGPNIDAGGTAGDAEQVLDIVSVIGMAPGVSEVRLYNGGNDGGDPFSEYVTENLCKQMSVSWVVSDEDTLFQEMAAQGQSLFTASGDWGNPPLAMDESIWVTGVGGTHLVTNGPGGSWNSEYGWLASGAGPSPDGTLIPSYQSWLNGVNGTSTTLRGIPDVSIEGANPNYGCTEGTCDVEGGTSYSAPRYAALIAMANEQAVAAGNTTLGLINPALYNLAQSSHYASDFHDITTGNSDYNGAPFYLAGLGYDYVSGLGTPIGQNLINDLTIAIPPTFSLAPGTYASTQSVQLSTITPNATIYYTIDGSTPTTSSTLYSGAITVTNTETIQAIAVSTGYANSAVASAAYIIDLTDIATTTALTSSLTPSLLNQSVTFTATVTQASGTIKPSGIVQFYIDGIAAGSPVTLNGSGVATFVTSTLWIGTASVTATYLPNIGTIFTTSISNTINQVVDPVTSGTILTVGPTGEYATPCPAILAAAAGDTIEIDYNYGIAYQEPPDPTHGDRSDCVWYTNGLTIEGIGGRPLLDGTGATYQKGIFNPRGANETFLNLEIANSTCSSNCAGIRVDAGTTASPAGGDITVQYCYIHDSNSGIYTQSVGSTYGAAYLDVTPFFVLQYDEFNNNGITGGGGENDNTFIGADTSGALVLNMEYTWSHDDNYGFTLRDWAPNNDIYYNLIGDGTGNAIWLTQFSDGGSTYLVGNTFYKVKASTASGNDAGTGIVHYMDTDGGYQYGAPQQDLHFVNNTVLSDPSNVDTAYLFLNTGVSGPVTANAVVQNNIFVGPPGQQIINQATAITSNNLVVTNNSTGGNLANGSNVTGLFVNAAALNFNLASTASNAIGKGLTTPTNNLGTADPKALAVFQLNNMGTYTNGAFVANPAVRANIRDLGSFYNGTSLSSTPASIAVSSGNNQSALIGNNFTNPLIVLVEDAGSNPVSNATVTFASSSVSFPGGAIAITNASGLASVVAQPDFIGTNLTVTASVSGVTQPASFTENGTGGTILTVGPTGEYATPCTAIKAAVPGDIIQIDYNGGTPYQEIPDGSGFQDCFIYTNGLTIEGVNGRPVLDGTGGNYQKGILVPYGANETFINLEISNSSCPSQGYNCAGIRVNAGTTNTPAGGNITVQYCYIHSNDMGILSANTGPGSYSGTPNPAKDGAYLSSTPFITLQNDELFNNSNSYVTGDFGHNIYIGFDRSNTDVFNMQNSWSHDAFVGHTVKSRTPINNLYYNLIGDELGNTSYVLDFPLGGSTYIVGNTLYKVKTVNDAFNNGQANSGFMVFADTSDNSVMGPEYGPTGQDLHFINNTVVLDPGNITNAYVNLGCGNVNLSSCSVPNNGPALSVNAVIQNNIFVGPAGREITNQTTAVQSNNLVVTNNSTGGTPTLGTLDLLTNGSNVTALFVNPAAYNFNLVATATNAIGKGLAAPTNNTGAADSNALALFQFGNSGGNTNGAFVSNPVARPNVKDLGSFYNGTSLSSTPASIAVSSGNNQSALIGNNFTNPLIVLVEDAGSNPVSNATVTFASSSVSFPGGAIAITNASGLASVVAQPDFIGTNLTVTASVSGVTQPASFTENGTGGTILTVGPTGEYATPCTAIKAAVPGDIIQIAYNNGTPYHEPADPTHGNRSDCVWYTNDLTIEGVGGRPILDATGETIQKGILNPRGANETISNLELRNSTCGNNCAGIRVDAGTTSAPGGGNITVQYCYIHDNEDGILTDNVGPGSGSGNISMPDPAVDSAYLSPTPFLTFQYDEFNHNGGGDSGFTHNMYIGYDSTDSLTFSLLYSWSHDANQTGVEVKTRAPINNIYYNLVNDNLAYVAASDPTGNGNAGFNFEIPQGGSTYIVGNVIAKGPPCANCNQAQIMWRTQQADTGADDPVYGQPHDDLHFVNNTVYDDPGNASPSQFVTTDCYSSPISGCGAYSPTLGPELATPPVFENNIFIGGTSPMSIINADLTPTPVELGNINLANTGANLSSLNFTNPTGLNFQLLTGSSAIGAGISTPTLGDGVTPDPKALASFELGNTGAYTPGSFVANPVARANVNDAGAFLYVSSGVATTTALTSSANPSTYGQSVTFTDTVTEASGTVTPTGTVQFSIDGSAVGEPVTLNSGGQGTYATSTLAAGSHSVTVVYTPSGSFTTSTATPLTQVVNQASATLTLTSTNGSGTVGVMPVVTSDYTLTGFQGTDTQASACTGTPAITTTATSASPVSPPTYPITVANGTLVCSSTDYTYTITDVSTGVYTINGAGTSPLTLTTTNNPSNPITYGSSVPSVATDYTLTGFIGGDTQASACTGTPTLSTTATSSSAPGSYPITAVVGTLVCTSIHATYTVTIVNNGNVVIGKASATLTLTSTSASGSTGVTPVVLSDYSLTGFQGTDTQATACTGAPSVTTSATSSSPAGPYPITATVGTLACSSSNATYTIVIRRNSGQLTLTGSTGPTSQTITFPMIPYQSYGAVGTVFNPGATASSGLAITYTVVYGPATVSGNGVMITGSGDITVTASQAGNTTYSAATPITRTFSVLQSGVSWPSPTSITYGTPASAFMTVQSTITTGTTVYSNGAQVLTPTTVLAAGKYSISAVFTSTPGWVLKIPLTLVVAPAPLTVTVNSLSVTYNSQVPASYSYSIAGFVNGDPSSVVTGVPTITTTATAKATKTSGVSLYTSPVGSYALNATTGSLKATNYTFTFVSGTLTITPATTPLTITATNVNIMYASQLPATYRYTVTGLLGFDSAASAGTGTPSITSTATTTSPAGTYPITAAAGTFLAPNYSGVIYVNGTANIVR